MKRHARELRVLAALAALAALPACGPSTADGPPAASPAPDVNVPPPDTAAPTATAAAPPECPPGTAWNGEQCSQPQVAEPAPTAPPEPTQPPLESPPPGTFVVEGGALKLPGPIYFDIAKDTIKPSSDPVLSYVRSYLLAKPEITLLRVEGHTDNHGSNAANQKLSEARALSVARWLVAHGIDCKRLIAVGFGETKPILPNNTAEGREQNRRIAFVNAALRGKAIGGLPVDGGGKVAGDPCASGP